MNFWKKLWTSVLLVVLTTTASAAFGSNEPISPIPQYKKDNPDLWALGRLLFHERRFSYDNSISCASCHNLSANGADDKRFSVGVNNQVSEFNTPTVFNAVYNFRQFWDGRVKTLVEQVDGPVHDPDEFNSNWAEVVSKLAADQAISDRFEAVFHRPVDALGLAEALAEFESSLVTPDSPFDRYLKGDDNAISDEAKEGYDLFKSYACVSCHNGVNVGGNMYQKLGIFKTMFDENNPPLKRDFGRFNATGKEEDKFVFKVPSLRNVALTPPYFHNGQISSLHEAVKLMGQYQLGVELDPIDIELIVAFLTTLTGEQLRDL